MLIEFLGPMAPMIEGVKDRLGPDIIFNHCTSLPNETWRLFADVGGIFAWQQAIDHGIRPGIGTDLETAYGGDMPTELRVAFSLQRAIAQSRRYAGEAPAPAPIGVEDLLRAATIDGARCAGLDRRTGSLTVGKDADLIMVRTDSIELLGTNNAAGAIVHAADRSHIDSIMVAGRFRKRHGRLVDVDLANIRTRAESSLAHLFSAIGYEPDTLAARFEPLSTDPLPAWTGQ